MKMLAIRGGQESWINEAWAISDAIASMPSEPPGPFMPAGQYRKDEKYLNALAELARPVKDYRWPIPYSKAKAILLLQDRVGLYLSYRLRKHHKVSPRVEDGKTGLGFFKRITPKQANDYRVTLEAAGVKFTLTEEFAIQVHVMLGQILIDRYVCNEWKRKLPLSVASISGESVSRRASIKGSQPRERKNELKQAKFDAQRRHPHATWKELLNVLEGDCIVTEWDETRIHWTTGNGATKTITPKAFKNWGTGR